MQTRIRANKEICKGNEVESTQSMNNAKAKRSRKEAMRQWRQKKKQQAQAHTFIPFNINYEEPDLRVDTEQLNHLIQGFTDEKCNNDPFLYHKKFTQVFSIRVTTILTTHFIENVIETNKNKAQMMRLRKDSPESVFESRLKHYKHFRKYQIEIEMDGRWTPLFEIKKSTIANAGLGLFAVQNFPRNTDVGIYVGKVMSQKAWEKRIDEIDSERNYAFQFKRTRHGTTRDHVIDPTIPNADGSDLPSYFGLHFANDPTLGLKGEALKKSQDKINVMIGSNLIATTNKDIHKGDEIFLHYQWK